MTCGVANAVTSGTPLTPAACAPDASTNGPLLSAAGATAFPRTPIGTRARLQFAWMGENANFSLLLGRLQLQILHYHLQVLPRFRLLSRIAQQKCGMIGDSQLAIKRLTRVRQRTRR